MSAVTITLLLIALYAGALIAGLLVSQPLRYRLVATVNYLEHTGAVHNGVERAHLEWLIESSSSTAVGMLLPFTAINVLATEALGGTTKLDPELARLAEHPRYHEAVLCYMGSVVLCSPVAFLVALPAIIGLGLINAYRKRHLVDAIETPLLNATSHLQPC